MKKLIAFISFIYLLPVLLNGQSSENNELDSATNNPGVSIETLKEVNKLFEENEFYTAQELLVSILEKDSLNYNANFKLGLCLLRSADKQENAHIYFKKAAKSMIAEYDFLDTEIIDAPYDALYFLGRSYMFINEPDSALKSFKDYNDRYYGDPPISVEAQIIMCNNALSYLKSPRNVSIKNMGKGINSESVEMYPVMTIDNSVLFFSSKRVRNDESNAKLIDKQSGLHHGDIYFAGKNKSGAWTKAQLFEHNSEKNDAPVFISSDGLTLYIRREEDGDGDFLQTSFEDGVWSVPSRIKSKINSHFDESGLSITGDGQTMYFASEREGGFGESDIFKSEKTKKGKWGTPVNIGETINSSSNEISPFIIPNGKTLFFSTDGNKLKGSGGLDVFYSELMEDGSWSEPQSMGYPINTTRDEFNYYITEGGIRYYNRSEKGRSYELYKIEGGGFDAETLKAGTIVVTLTEEMAVSEVLEVIEEVEVEIEVIETIETEVIVESEVEVIDLEALTEFDDEINSGSLSDESLDEEDEASSLSDLKLDSIGSADRKALIEKVQNYLAKQVASSEENSNVLKTIYFNKNSYRLDLFKDNEQQTLISLLESRPDGKIKVVGYTDTDGKTNPNLILSNERAKAVFNLLVKKGISKERLEYYGKGVYNPIATNDTNGGKSKNRRVEILLLDK